MVSLTCYTITAVTCYVITITIVCSTITEHLIISIIVALTGNKW